MLGELDHPLGGNRRGAENIDIDAARHHPDSRWIGAVAVAYLFCDKLGDRDDALAPRHDRVVELLGRVADIVVAVKRRHEGGAGAFRGVKRTPGRCTRSCMDDIDIVLVDQGGELRDVAPHLQRVFGRRREIDIVAPARLISATICPPLDATSARHPASVIARATSTAPRSTPPVTREGRICKMVGGDAPSALEDDDSMTYS